MTVIFKIKNFTEFLTPMADETDGLVVTGPDLLALGSGHSGRVDDLSILFAVVDWAAVREVLLYIISVFDQFASGRFLQIDERSTIGDGLSQPGLAILCKSNIRFHIPSLNVHRAQRELTGLQGHALGLAAERAQAPGLIGLKDTALG